MPFKYLFFILAFLTLTMSGVLITNHQRIELFRIEAESEARSVSNAIQAQVMIEHVCAGRGGSLIGTTLNCN